MFLSDLAIRRPVLASMASAALVLFGVIGYQRLAVREFPDVDPPIISVSVTLRGANPRVMESAVTDVLEEQLSSLEGLRQMTSSSGEQRSNITLEFNLERPIEAAAQDTRDLVSRIRGRLPQQIEEPVISKQDADAQPFMWILLRGDGYDLMTLSDVADRLVKTPLMTIPGIASAQVRGERRYAMRVWIEPAELAARGLTVQDVNNAIRTRNVEVPAGRIESDRREFSIRSMGELKTPEEFGSLVVSSSGGQLVRLRDVARVELGPEDDRSRFRFNGAPGVGVSLTRQSKSNQVQVAEIVRAELPRIEESLPPGMELVLGFDSSVFVKRSISEAQETLLIAGALVVLIIFVFLRNLRATFIPGIAIPASIIATFAVMNALGFSINSLTLLALTLAIGIVVDDAIIVMENAYRHQEELGETPEEAASRGTGEIAFAVITTTISLVAVFTPLAFLGGNTGRLFREFGLAVAGSVVISGFVALTLTPMLCAKILKVPSRHGRLYQALEGAFNGLARGYKRTLTWALHHRAAVVGVVLAVSVSAGVVFTTLKREFVPAEDRGNFRVSLTAPEGATVQYMDEYQVRAERILDGVPEIDSYTSIVGWGGRVNSGFLIVRLQDWADRSRSVQEVLREIQPQLNAIPGVLAFASNPPAFGGRGSPVQFVIQHPDFDELAGAMDQMLARARQVPGLQNVDADLRVNKPELVVSFDRDRAEDLGVPVSDVANTMSVLLGSSRVSTFTRDNKLYDVIVQLSPEARATPSDMAGLTVRGRGGELIQLQQLSRVEETTGPRQLNHFNRMRASTLSASLVDGFTLGEALDSLNAIAAEVLPPGSQTALAGESRELAESGSALYFAFILALIIVFMVLASQFESLVHPFTVLLAVPLAVSGAIFALWIMGSTVNLYSQIGMILLIGLVTKNSILLVEYANQLKGKGLATLEAVAEAGRIRLRPILMTSIATIMGALPIALGLGAGSISRRPLGFAIVGGLIVSTLFTLYLVPVAYSLFDAAFARRRGRVLQPVPVAAPEAE
jgi:multidrug efflux pump